MGVIKSAGIDIKDSNTLIHRFTVSEDIEQYFKNDELKVTYPVDILGVPKGILSIPLVSNLCTVAWFTGNILYVEELDQNIANSLQSIKQGYKNTFNKAGYYPNLDGEVIIKNERDYSDKKQNECQPATLFTGGVDSVYGYLQKIKESPRLITVKREKDKKEEWQTRRDNVQGFADYFDLECYFVETHIEKNLLNQRRLKIDNDILWNMDKSWWTGVQYIIGYMGLMAPLMYVEQLSPLYQSSGVTEESLLRNPGSNPDIVDRLFWGDTVCEMPDFGVSRQKKMNYIISHAEQDWPFNFHSCGKGKHGSECGSCKRCYRNILGILVAGGDPSNFGYDVGEDTYSTLINMFSVESMSLYAVEAEFYQDIQANLNKNIFTGPDELFRELKSVNIKIDNSKSEHSFKYNIWKQLPYPINESVFNVWEEINAITK